MQYLYHLSNIFGKGLYIIMIIEWARCFRGILQVGKQIMFGTYYRRINHSKISVSKSIFTKSSGLYGSQVISSLYKDNREFDTSEVDPEILLKCENEGFFSIETPVSTEWLMKNNIEEIQGLDLFDTTTTSMLFKTV